MSFLRKFFPTYLYVSLFALNAYACFHLASSLSVVDHYRTEVRQIALDVSQIATNFLVSASPSSSSPFAPGLSPMDVPSAPSSPLSPIPYRFAVVRGVAGLSSGGLGWYPVGSALPYGVLTSCTRDFACFDGHDWYTLSYE